jgi:hypothetical protein
MTCRMGRLYIPRLADLCLAAFLLGAAAGAASRADEADYESRIGVLNDCLSIRNGALAPGTPVTIIRFNSQEDEPFVSGDTRERRIAARIVAKTDTAECPAWVEDRTLREDSAELSLYTISPEIPGMLDSVEFGIGIVGIPPGDEKPIDFDSNGAVDTLAEFVTYGGLVFEVWAGKIWFGEPFWTGSWHYYHGPEGDDADCDCDEVSDPGEALPPASDPAP